MIVLHCPYYPTLAPVDSKEKLCGRVNRGFCGECSGPDEISDTPINEQPEQEKRHSLKLAEAIAVFKQNKKNETGCSTKITAGKTKRGKSGGRQPKTKKHCESCGKQGFLEYAFTCSKCYKAKERQGKRIKCRIPGCENMSTSGLCRSCYKGKKPAMKNKRKEPPHLSRLDSP